MSRFAELVAKLRAKGESDDEATGVAAKVGRRKYGKRRFQQMAAAGRKKALAASAVEHATGLALAGDHFKHFGAKKSLAGDRLMQDAYNKVLRGQQNRIEPGKAVAAIRHAREYAGAEGAGVGHGVRRLGRRMLQEAKHARVRLPAKILRTAGKIAKIYAPHIAVVAAATYLQHKASQAKKKREHDYSQALSLGAGPFALRAKRVIKTTYGRLANSIRKGVSPIKSYFNKATSAGRQAFKTATGTDPIANARNASLGRLAARKAVDNSQRAAFATQQAGQRSAARSKFLAGTGTVASAGVGGALIGGSLMGHRSRVRKELP